MLSKVAFACALAQTLVLTALAAVVCPLYPCAYPICDNPIQQYDAQGCPMCFTCSPSCPSSVCTELCIAGFTNTQVIRCDGCKVCQCCPVLDKCPPCPNGYLKDSNGCPTCQCQVVKGNCASLICPYYFVCQTMCGTDGHDYCNTCEIRVKNCRDHTHVTVSHLGSCNCPTPVPICPKLPCAPPPPCPEGQELVTPHDAQGCPLCPICRECPKYKCPAIPEKCPVGQVPVVPRDAQGCPQCPRCTAQ